MDDGFCIYETEMGKIRISYDNGNVVGIRFVTDDAPGAGCANALTDEAARELGEYFAGKRTSFDFPYIAEGTEFRKAVWSEVGRIPYGETRSYGEIACSVGKPNAVRAVGHAIGKNPILIAIPCHRVIGKNGKMTGYACGTDRKASLLYIEKRYR